MYRYAEFLIGVFVLLVCISSGIAADEESLGKQAEQAGKLREALTHYVEALKSAPLNQQLREKIIKLSQQIQPPSAIPEDAKRHMARGHAAIKAAKVPEDWAEAVKEYEIAVYFAPWFADAYYNLGVARDKAGQHDGAIWALKKYLLAAPNAPDVEKVKEQIYALEYTHEKIQKQEREKAEKLRQEELVKAEQVKRTEFLKRVLEGNWSIAFCSMGRVGEGPPGDILCNSREYADGRHWWGVKTLDGARDELHQFVFTSIGTVEVPKPFFSGKGVEKIVGGAIVYRDIRDIVWSCNFKDGRESSAWWAVDNDNSGIVLSCERPSGSSVDPSVRYPYMYLRKR